MGRQILLVGTGCVVILSVLVAAPLPKRMQRFLELSREVTFSKRLDEVSPYILNLEDYPKWWKQLRSVERLASDEAGLPTYRIVDTHGHAYRPGSKCTNGGGSVSTFARSILVPLRGRIGFLLSAAVDKGARVPVRPT